MDFPLRWLMYAARSGLCAAAQRTATHCISDEISHTQRFVPLFVPPSQWDESWLTGAPHGTTLARIPGRERRRAPLDAPVLLKDITDYCRRAGPAEPAPAGFAAVRRAVSLAPGSAGQELPLLRQPPEVPAFRQHLLGEV